MPPSSPSTTAPYACLQCGKRFGKSVKLDRHLLDAHHASLRLSPERSLPQHVSHLLASAVSESNAVFANSPAANHCPRCGDAGHKPFKNARDLAQHLLAKHMDDAEIDTPLSAHSLEQPQSEISCKRKAPDSHQFTDNSPQSKRPRLQTTSPTTPAAKPKGSSKPKSKVKRRSSAPARTSVPSPVSATKPPVTPNKPPIPSSNPLPSVPCLASAAVRLPAHAMITTAPMHFCAFAGFAANSRKSYYRLSNR